MPLYQERNGILSPVNFGYDAVKDTGRRKAPSRAIYSEDATLNTSDRNKLSSTIADQTRNFSVLAWAIRKHISYVTNHSFRALTADDSFNARLTELMEWWSKKENCDISGKHNLQRMIDILEMCRVKDGDVFLLKLRSGHLQAIEADRINTATDMPVDLADNNWIHGVLLDKNNRPKKYAVTSRAKNSAQYVFERAIDANNIIPLGYYTRFDQTRGVSPLSSAVNVFQDLYESFDANLTKSKMAAMFGLAIQRELPESAGDFEYSEYEFDLKPGLKLELLPGESVNTIESKNPSTEFKNFSEMMLRLGLLALDIPYTYIDSTTSNYSFMRQDRIEYCNATAIKQADITAVLNEITRWKINQWVGTGLLRLPAGFNISTVPFVWSPARVPLLDPQKEYAAYQFAIDLGLQSRQQISQELGIDWEQTINELAKEKEIMDAAGLGGF